MYENHRCAQWLSTACVGSELLTCTVLRPDACTKQKPKELDPEPRAGAAEGGVCIRISWALPALITQKCAALATFPHLSHLLF